MKYRDKLTVAICDDADLERMRMCIRLKIEQHPVLREWLVATGEGVITEDCTARPADIEVDGKNHFNGLPFWGARDVDGEWVGFNAMGKLWMELRAEVTVGDYKRVKVPK